MRPFFRWARNQKEKNIKKYGKPKLIEYFPHYVVLLCFVLASITNYYDYYIWEWPVGGFIYEHGFVNNASLCNLQNEAIERINIWRNSLLFFSFGMFLMLLRLFPQARAGYARVGKSQRGKITSKEIFSNIFIILLIPLLVSYYVYSLIKIFDYETFCTEEYSRMSDKIFIPFYTGVCCFLLFFFLTISVELFMRRNKNTNTKCF